MKQHTVVLSGMNCDACERIIQKVAERNKITITIQDAKKGTVLIHCADATLPLIKKELAIRGFAEKGSKDDLGRGQFINFIRYLKDILLGKTNVVQEALLVRHALISGFLLLVLNLAVYVYFVQTKTNAVDFIPFLILGILTSIAITFSYLHARCFKNNLSCQNGMMVGMTLGMVSGFLVGELIAATNGMFVGCVVGIIVGVLIGVYGAKSCGVMSVMEGMMAGIMSGLMGPMTVIMTLNDNMLPLMYLVFVLFFALLGGLSYMLYREEGDAPIVEKTKLSKFIVFSILLNLVILAIMFFGPKGPLTFI